MSNAIPSWMKSGATANAELVKEDEKAQARQSMYDQQKNRVFPFFIKPGEEAEITFLDGDLIEEGADAGILDLLTYRQHTVNVGGKWQDFVCTSDTEPCPICAEDNTPAYVGVFTVIDHSSYISKTNGKEYKDTQKLFVAKRGTLKKLQKYATKFGGLRGLTFEVSRDDQKGARVGTDFITNGVKKTDAELESLYGPNSKPVDYGEAITYLTAKELNALGIGNPISGVGGSYTPVAVNDDEGSIPF